MTWTRFSDDYSDDCWSLSDQAFRLHTEALVWSNRKLLDCRIPKADVRRFAKCPEAIPELLAAGWWSKDEDGYILRHHAAYQRDAESVVKQQAVNKANARKRRKPPKPPREVWSASGSLSESISEPLGESHSERDGTGLEGNSLTGSTSNLSEQVSVSSSNPSHSSSPAEVCGWCKKPNCTSCLEASA
jgi:hypothetical protein